MAEANRIARMDCPTQADLKKLKYIIINKCSHIKETELKDLDRGILRVFGRWAAIYDAESLVYQKVAEEGQLIVSLMSQDEQSSSVSNAAWTKAQRSATRMLDKKVDERAHLKIFSGLMVEFTQRSSANKWVNGQVGVIVDLPTHATVSKKEDLKVWAAPIGITELPNGGSYDKVLLKHAGWTEVAVSFFTPLRNEKVDSLLGRRIQYSIRPLIGKTVHRVMGHDVNKLVTCVGAGSSKYRLWERGQIVVILSRTPCCKNMYFIGDPKETADEIVNLILKRGAYDEYMEKLIRCIAHDGSSDGGGIEERRDLNNERCVKLTDLPYRLKDARLPSDETGFVYLLVSLSNCRRIYIGSTNNLRERVLLHNRGHGAEPTRNPAYGGKWGLAGFVAGFEAEKERYEFFERRWSHMVSDNGGDTLDVDSVWDLGVKLVADLEEYNGIDSLNLVKCFETNI
eukprot:scaffold244588_cov43-Attheya_sp.AAC.3